MNRKFFTTIIAGALMVTSALPLTVQAGRGGGGGGGGQMGGASLQTQNRIQDRDRLRLRDGSCTNSTPTQAGTKKGKTYGPGDGTGNAGVGPKDGTGYGAPLQR